MLRVTSLLLTLVLLGSCAGRPGADVLQAVNTRATAGKSIAAYVVSTREKEAGKTLSFGAGRADQPNYARFDISIPQDHKKGKIEWPSGKPDAKKDFVVTDRDMLSKDAFKHDLAGILSSGKDVGLFVHGYNYSYQEALFRAAQMAADADINGVPVVFSWPSMADVTGYLADKEAATFSRDALADLLIDLAQKSPRKNVIVFGHSMGAWLVMEALRELRLKGRNDVIAKLQVILAAPDIDTDVFRKQIEVVGRLDPPLTVLVSKDDRALMAASLLAGERSRVGALDVTDPEISKAAKREGVQFVDISELDSSDGFNHDRYAALAALLPKLDEKRRGGGNDLTRAGAFVLDAVGATVSSPFRLASKVVNPN